MKSVVAMTLMLFLCACASTGRPGEATRTARDTVASCAPGYVEDPVGSGICEPYDQSQQQRRGMIRQTVGGALSQPAPSLGGLRR
jgi:hypothetical protein